MGGPGKRIVDSVRVSGARWTASLVLDRVLNCANPGSDVQENYDDRDPGKDMFLTLGKTAEDAMTAALPWEEVGTLHG